jgi:hypothetical protein
MIILLTDEIKKLRRELAENKSMLLKLSSTLGKKFEIKISEHIQSCLDETKTKEDSH